MGHVGDGIAVENAVARMGNGFVERMRTDADRGPSQVVLSDVDGVQRRIPRVPPPMQDVCGVNRVVL